MMPNLAKANLLSRKTRSVITIFGIALSVALLLVMVGMVNGTVRDVANRILNIGADIMVGGDSWGVFYPSEVVDGRYAGKIAEVEGVDKVAPVLVESAPNINKKKQFNYIYGIDYDNFVSLGDGFNFLSGRRLQDPMDIIIDEKIATVNEIAVGDEIKFFDRQWTVVGVINDPLGARMLVDRTQLAEIVHPGRNPNLATLFYVKVERGTPVDTVAARIEEHMGEDWSVNNLAELFELFIGGALGLKEFIIALIGVSAIICFAVILLSMYNAIIERTREIGILKSLGATKKFIIIEIVKEAMIIVAIGIIVGFALTWMGQQVLSTLFPLVQVEITLHWMLLAAVIASIATLLGTVYPAWRASRLDPVEALNWE